MDQASRDELNRITSLAPHLLTPEEIGFLCARRSYLGKRDKEEFKEVIAKHDADLKAAQEA